MHCETWFDVKLVETWMHAQDTYALVIVCMSARKKAPVNLLMCTFELYMFIGVSMQLRELSEVSSDPILLVGCTWKEKKIRQPLDDLALLHSN